MCLLKSDTAVQDFIVPMRQDEYAFFLTFFIIGGLNFGISEDPQMYDISQPCEKKATNFNGRLFSFT